MTIKEKLIAYIEAKNLSVREFERRAGLSNGYIKSLRQSPTIDKMQSIIRAFPDFDTSMLVPEKTSTPAETRPRIPYDAAAGTITESMEGVTAYQCEQIPVIPIFPRYDFTIRIYGDSMEPEYHSGDEVACLNINTTHFIQWGRVHVLDTMQGIVIKRIYEDGDNIRCRSYNKDYPDFLVPKEEIRSFNLVVGSLRI